MDITGTFFGGKDKKTRSHSNSKDSKLTCLDRQSKVIFMVIRTREADDTSTNPIVASLSNAQMTIILAAIAKIPSSCHARDSGVAYIPDVPSISRLSLTFTRRRSCRVVRCFHVGVGWKPREGSKSQGRPGGISVCAWRRANTGCQHIVRLGRKLYRSKDHSATHMGV